MTYYIAKTLDGPIDAVATRVVEALKSEGFGVPTEIDVSSVLKEKIGADLPPYRILGACNPKLAHQALSAENKIGVMLPCNVILRQEADGRVEVAAVDPVASMGAVQNAVLAEIAGGVRDRLAAVVNGL